MASSQTEHHGFCPSLLTLLFIKIVACTTKNIHSTELAFHKMRSEYLGLVLQHFYGDKINTIGSWLDLPSLSYRKMS